MGGRRRRSWRSGRRRAAATGRSRRSPRRAPGWRRGGAAAPRAPAGAGARVPAEPGGPSAVPAPPAAGRAGRRAGRRCARCAARERRPAGAPGTATVAALSATARRAARACGAVSRACGSRSSSPSRTGSSGPAATYGSCSPVTTAVTVSSGSPPPSYGGRPSTAVNSVAPSDHRSDGGPGACPRARSGAMYAGEPSSRPVLVMLASPAVEAMPKSVSTTRPGRPPTSGPSRTLPGLHVAVDDALPVGGLEGAEQREPDVGGALRRQRAVGAHDLRQRAGLDELHDEVGRALLLHDVVDGDGARVVEPGGGPRLAAGALAQDVLVALGQPGREGTSLTATSRPSSSSSARQTVPMPPTPSGDEEAVAPSDEPLGRGVHGTCLPAAPAESSAAGRARRRGPRLGIESSPSTERHVMARAAESGFPIKPVYGPADLPPDLPGAPGRARAVPVHPRRLPEHVHRPAVDDAPVRRLRHRQGVERALPPPRRAGHRRAVGRLRPADADGLRLRRPDRLRRGRQGRRRHRLARGHAAAVRPDPARERLDVDDHQRAGVGAAADVRAGGRGARRRPATSSPARSRTTCSRSTSPAAPTSTRRRTRCG